MARSLDVCIRYLHTAILAWVIVGMYTALDQPTLGHVMLQPYVLLVDGDYHVLEVLATRVSESLSHTGLSYRILRAGSAFEARAIVASELKFNYAAPLLLVSAWQLPDETADMLLTDLRIQHTALHAMVNTLPKSEVEVFAQQVVLYVQGLQIAVAA